MGREDPLCLQNCFMENNKFKSIYILKKEKAVLEFIWNHKRSQIPKVIMSKTILDLELYEDLKIYSNQ